MEFGLLRGRAKVAGCESHFRNPQRCESGFRNVGSRGAVAKRPRANPRDPTPLRYPSSVPESPLTTNPAHSSRP
ncbi:hypothetical protein DL990_36200 [Amycolatopsis sp. WAC 01416]|nr:hypothetical protein DL990_36200 [Amycolatopsis sp. WAC 01416]